MLPVNYSMAGAMGAADTDPIAVSGIAASDILLAAMAWDLDGDPIGIDVSEATLGAGTVTLDTTDTSNMQVWFIWAPSS